MRYCQNCGTVLQEQMKFCPSCGKQQPVVIIGKNSGVYSTSSMFRENTHREDTGVISNLFNAAKNGIADVVQTVQFRQNPSAEKNAYSVYIEKQAYSINNQVLTNCPNCGSPIDSFSPRCNYCGTELTQKAQATACKELCNRLDLIEASRPKETLFSYVTGLVNTALDHNKLDSTDQQKIELISSFVVPNTKTDIMEFLFLAKTRIEACSRFSSSTDEYVARVQKELFNVWTVKLEQTIEKAKLVLPNDPDFRSFYVQYKKANYRSQNLCQYCGGRFKGFVQKTCVNCGRPKDY